MHKERADGIYSFDDEPWSQSYWNRYVFEAASASFYHQFEWKSVFETEFGHETFYLASVRSGVVDGVLPMVLIRSRLFGRILCSLPFLNYCGPSAGSSETEKALLTRAYEIAADRDVDFLEIRGLKVCDDKLPRSEDKISMTVPLAADPEELWSTFRSKHRTSIRRAYKSGLSVKSGRHDMLDTFYDIMCHSWRALGTPIYRKSYFRSILDKFGDQIRIFVVFQDSIPVATAFNGHCGTTVEGMWAGTLPQYRNLQSNYVLYWEMIKSACTDGFESFHLGRSSADSGGESFKKKWGAWSKQLYWQYYLPPGAEMPQLNVQNPKYSIAISVWKKTPLWMTRTIGPLLARSIP